MDKVKLLVVDDERVFSRILKLNLEQTGKYLVKMEDQGEKALKTAVDFMPNIILLDVIMPDMSGPVLANKIRSHDKLGHIPIGFLTATVMKKGIKAVGNQIDGIPCIHKPISVEELTHFINAILKGKKDSEAA